jgi:hypothetical protein
VDLLREFSTVGWLISCCRYHERESFICSLYICWDEARETIEVLLSARYCPRVGLNSAIKHMTNDLIRRIYTCLEKPRVSHANILKELAKQLK